VALNVKNSPWLGRLHLTEIHLALDRRKELGGVAGDMKERVGGSECFLRKKSKNLNHNVMLMNYEAVKVYVFFKFFLCFAFVF
jgi:hypothetical protein